LNEKDEIKEIKADILHQLMISNIRGFENFDFYKRDKLNVDNYSMK